MVTKAGLAQWIERAYQAEYPRFEDEVQKGIQQIQNATPLFGFSPPGWFLAYAATSAFLYRQQGQAQYADQAKQALWYYRDWLTHLPAGAERMRPEYENGVPPMEPVFQPVVFGRVVQAISAALTAQELDTLAEMAAATWIPAWRFPEWGGHNRAMLRAAGLALSAQAFPNHPDAPQWAGLADELAEESWGRWSIEDAMLYQPHWLRALILYAGARGIETELADLVQPRLHLKAATQLISPLGILPDFGDSHWLMDSHWEWMACLEWGARAYQDGAMKWTASRLYERLQHHTPTAGLAAVAALAWEWCDDSVAEHPPLNPDDALDDLVLKKSVWRTGWTPDAAYACLNYRDEGEYGRVARDYLRATLAVSAEKMHHGHADEGSISMLVADGTLLLHESGYREKPPDGIYRSAVYHNRLTWCNHRPAPGEALPAFLRGDGSYRPVRTERLYHTSLLDASLQRFRVTDETDGLVWDRSVIFLPALPCWVVIDSALAARDAERTVSGLWWTTDILARYEHWFETHIRGVMDWQNRRHSALLIGLLPVAGQDDVLSAEPFRRHFQDEIGLARTWSGLHRAGEYLNFATVLWPHGFDDLDEQRAQAFEVVESQPRGRGLGIRLRWDGEERLFGTLNDLSAGCTRPDFRPTYTAEAGMAHYGPLRSDAALAYLRQDAQGGAAGFINGTALAAGDQTLYQGLPHDMFQENATAATGIPARFRWQGRFDPEILG